MTTKYDRLDMEDHRATKEDDHRTTREIIFENSDKILYCNDGSFQLGIAEIEARKRDLLDRGDPRGESGPTFECLGETFTLVSMRMYIEDNVFVILTSACDKDFNVFNRLMSFNLRERSLVREDISPFGVDSQNVKVYPPSDDMDLFHHRAILAAVDFLSDDV